MIIDTPSLILGLALGLLLPLGVRQVLPGFLRDAETRRMRRRIGELEDRLERKDELIRDAIKASGGQS